MAPLLRTKHPRYHFLRGALLLVTSVLAFLSLRYMPLAEFTAIVLIAPLAVTLLAATTLKEHVSPLRWTLVAGGFAGTLVILRPGGGASAGPSCCRRAGGHQCLVPGADQQARADREPADHALLHRLGRHADRSFALPFAWTALPGWQWWALLCLMGLMGTVGHFLLILAYQRAPASTLTPYLYAQIAFAMLGGWVMFSHIPDNVSLVGMGMIAACGAAGAWLTVRERRVPIEPAES